MKKILLALTISFLLIFHSFGQAGALDPDFIPNFGITHNFTIPGNSKTSIQPDGKLIFCHSGKIWRMDTTGKIDPDFQFSYSISQFRKSLVLENGKILIIGNLNPGMITGSNIFRLYANGLLDTTFKSTFLSGTELADVSLLDDGKLLVSGRVSEPLIGTNKNTVIRLHSSGKIDTAFHNPIFGGTIWEHQILTNGEILVGGNMSTVDNQAGRALVRLSQNGYLDTSFHYPTSMLRPFSIKQATNGNILVMGFSTNQIVQLTGNGSIDPQFSTITFNDFRPNGLAPYPAHFEVLANGKIILTGAIPINEAEDYLAAVRCYYPNGVADSGFEATTNNDGGIYSIHPLSTGRILLTGPFFTFQKKARNGAAILSETGKLLQGYYSPNSGIYGIETIAVQPDQKIIIGGSFRTVHGKERLQLARLEPDGLLDSTFIAPYKVGISACKKVAVQPDGKILALKLHTHTQFSEWTINRYRLERYNTNGSLDSLFLGGIATDLMGIGNFAIQPDGKILLCGSFDSLLGQPRGSLARLNTDGSLDLSFVPENEGRFGTDHFISLRPDGRILYTALTRSDAIYQDNIRQFLPNGTLDSTFQSQPILGSVAGMTPLKDGTILVFGGLTKYGKKFCNGIIRLAPNGIPDTNVLDLPYSSPNRYVLHCMEQKDGRLILSGRFKLPSGAILPILRSLPNGSRDTTFIGPQIAPEVADFYPLTFQKNESRLLCSGYMNTINNGNTWISRFLLEETVLSRKAVIEGQIFKNVNGDCIKDGNEIPMPFRFVKSEPGNGFGMTDADGRYRLQVDTGTSFVTHLTTHNSYAGQIVQQVCPSNNQPQTVEALTLADTVRNVNFANTLTECPNLVLSIHSDRLRRCGKNLISVLILNNGGVASDVSTSVWVRFPKYVQLVSSTSSYQFHALDSTYAFHVGSIPAQSSKLIAIIDSVICLPGITGTYQCTKAWFTPGNSCTPISPLWDGADLSVKGYCTNGITTFSIKNKGNAMSAPGNYRLYVDSIFAYTAPFSLGENDSSLIIPQFSGNHTIRIEVPQSLYHPQNTFAFAEVNCGNITLSYNWFASTTEYPVFQESCQPIRDSYDPNDKQVEPKGITSEGFVPAGRPFNYHIRFQNTGNDTAYKVVVRDYLDGDFDLASFEPGASSHPYTVSVSGNQNPVLDFTFNKINLVDSSTNPLLSQGFVSFLIWSKEDAALGSRLVNVADITFDQNDPIRTNYTLNTLYEPELLTGHIDSVIIQNTENNLQLALYPNPSDGIVYISTNEATSLAVINVLGQNLLKVGLLKIGNNSFDFRSLPKGIYILHLVGEKTGTVKRLVLK